MAFKKSIFQKIIYGALAAVGTISANIADVSAAPGDYDGDGMSDLSVALVDRGTNSTAWLTRLTNGANPLFWGFNVPADAFVTGKFYKNSNRNFPGVVYVSSANDPLEWYVKKADGTDTFIRYGLPGDTITNLGDWDGDGVTDMHVVRRRSDGLLEWYVALTANPRIVQFVFGLNGDRVGVSDIDGDGVVEMVALRSGFQWFTRKPSQTTITQVQWGLTGDFPILPRDLDGDSLADFIVTRRTSNEVQTAFIRYGNGQTATVALGLGSSVPQAGEFNNGIKFAWSQRDTGWTAIGNNSASANIFKFGIPTNVIIAPDGSVIQPTETGTFGGTTTVAPPPTTPDPTEPAPPTGGSTSFCSEVLDVRGGGRFIYKQSAPMRQAGIGTPIVGFRKQPTLIMNVNISNRSTSTIFDTRGNAIGRCPWATAHGHSGGRMRCTMETSSLRQTAIRNTGSATVLFKINDRQCVSVPDAGRCNGSVKGLCDRLIQ